MSAGIIRSNEDLQTICPDLTVEVLYSAPGEGKQTSKAKFTAESLPDHLPCPDHDGQGFQLFDAVASVVETRMQELQEAASQGMSADRILDKTPIINCAGTIKRAGERFASCGKQMKLIIRGTLV
jgi:hypothetical protein